MRRTPLLAALLLAALACGDPSGSAPPADTTTTPPPVPPALQLSPTHGALQAGATLPLSLGTVTGAPVGGAVSWSVALDPALSAAGADSLGRVTPDGVYHAPQGVAVATTVEVTARHPDGRSASARVALSPVALAGEWRHVEPRVTSAAAPGRVTITVRTSAPATGVRLVTAAETVTFEQFDALTWRAATDAAPLAARVVAGTGHANAGMLELDGEAGTVRLGFGVNVREASMPDVAVERLADDAQASPHLLNLRLDASYGASNPPAAALKRFYALLGDDYTFVSVVAPAQVTGNRRFQHVRNAVTGIGVALVDQGATWGSAARLEGLVIFPLDTYYDAGEQVMPHEIGHRWINFSRVPALRAGGAHWPIGDLASGVMGFSIGGSGAGGQFPFRLVPQGTDRWVLEPFGDAHGTYNDMELYLMGLLPASAVQPKLAFPASAAAGSYRAGDVLEGPATTVTVNDIVAAEGPRVPAFGDAPTTFRVGTIVFSAGRLLSAHEMAFFDAMTARGAAETTLPYAIGQASGTTKPFYVATGGRARLVMRLR